MSLGLNVDTYKSTLPNNLDLKEDYGLSPTIGYKYLNYWGNLALRTGLFFEWKYPQINNPSAPTGERLIKLRSYYVAIPINLQFKIHSKWEVFGGYNPRVLLAKTCEDCGNFDDEGKVLVGYWNAGFTYRMSPKWSADVGFHNAQTESYKDLKINTAQILLNYSFD